MSSSRTTPTRPVEFIGLNSGPSTSGSLERRKMLPRFVALLKNKIGGLIQGLALLFIASVPTLTLAQSPPLHIKIINAKTNKPITDERLNVALRTDQIGSIAMPTDKNGIILVDTGDATTVRILSNMYADCRPRGDLYTDYSIATIRKTGITTGNLCSSASTSPRPGVLLLYEIPKSYIPQYPAQPHNNLPHSDENPHVPPTPPQ